MDFETIIGLVMVVFYLLLQIRGNKKKRMAKQKKQRALEAPPVPTETREPVAQNDELEAALREIRQALGMEPPKPQPLPRKKTPSYEPEFQRPEPDFHDEAFESAAAFEEPFDSQEQAFESRKTFDEAFDTHEQAFEEQSPYSEANDILEQRFEDEAPYTEHPHPKHRHGIIDEPAKVVERPGRYDSLLAELRQSPTARRALIMSEILSEPRSKRPL